LSRNSETFPNQNSQGLI